MLSEMKNKPKQASIVFRVTLWYSFFLFGFILLLLGLVFLVSTSLSSAASKKELVEAATEISQGTEDYEAVDDGVYYSIYDSSGNIIQKSLPTGFDETLAFNQATVKEVTIGSRTYFYFDIEMTGGSRWLRAVMLSNHSNHELSSFLIALAIVSPVLLIIIVVGGYLILKRAFVPVNQLSQTALEISQSGDLSKRLHLPDKDDELHRLGQTFNRMLDTVEQSFQREKQFNNDVSHELRTPVAVLLSESEYGLTYAEDLEEARESFTVINRQAKRMKEMIGQILELSRLEKQTSLQKNRLNLSRLVEEKVRDFQKLSQEKGLNLEARLAEECYVLGDELLVNRLLDNLIGNALKFTKSQIDISLQKAGSTCQLVIADNGQGIAPAEMEKIWHRFYQVNPARQKNDQEGSGLGLSLVRQIVDLHGAQIDLRSEVGQGSQFVLTFQLV